MSIEERLNQLECANRRWRSLALALLLVMASMGILAVSPLTDGKEIIEAKIIRIRDDAGTVRIELNGNDAAGRFGQAGVRIYNRKGELRAHLSARIYPSLRLLDQYGHERLAVAFSPIGPTIQLHGDTQGVMIGNYNAANPRTKQAINRDTASLIMVDNKLNILYSIPK